MMHTVSLNPPRPLRVAIMFRGREFFLALAGLVVLVVGQMRVADSFYLLRRNFWYDEILMQTLVSDPDFGHAMRGLAAGIETHPPTLYILLRAFTGLAGGANEVTLRLFSLLATLTALAGLYLLLRQSFSSLVSFVTLLAIWCHPVVVVQAFEARFYTPLLAGVVWYAYSLLRVREPEAGRAWRVLVGVAAVYVCTVHYFGIIALGLVTAGELLARRWAGVHWSKGLAPAALGPLALAACLPLLLRQRAAMSVATWVEPASLGWSFQFLSRLLFPTGLAAVVVLAWLARLTRGEDAPDVGDTSEGSRLIGQMPLTALLFLPLVMIMFSFTVQSVLHEKYAFAAVAGLAPAVAYGASRMSRAWLLVLGAVLCLAGIREHHEYAQRLREHDQRFTAGLIADLRQKTADEDLVFDNLHNLYVVCRYAPDLAERCCYLDFEPGQIGNTPPDRVFARDLARHYEAFYAVPHLKKWDVLKTERHFYLVPSYPVGAAGSKDKQAYPGFATRPVTGEIYEAVATTAS
jgi:hypothetical protein